MRPAAAPVHALVRRKPALVNHGNRFNARGRYKYTADSDAEGRPEIFRHCAQTRPSAPFAKRVVEMQATSPDDLKNDPIIRFRDLITGRTSRRATCAPCPENGLA